MAKNKAKKSSSKKAAVVQKRVQRQVKIASKDGKITNREAQKIQKIGKPGISVKPAVKKAIASIKGESKNVKLGGTASFRLKINKRGLSNIVPSRDLSSKDLFNQPTTTYSPYVSSPFGQQTTTYSPYVSAPSAKPTDSVETKPTDSVGTKPTDSVGKGPEKLKETEETKEPNLTTDFQKRLEDLNRRYANRYDEQLAKFNEFMEQQKLEMRRQRLGERTFMANQMRAASADPRFKIGVQSSGGETYGTSQFKRRKDLRSAVFQGIQASTTPTIGGINI